MISAMEKREWKSDEIKEGIIWEFDLNYPTLTRNGKIYKWENATDLLHTILELWTYTWTDSYSTF